MDIMMKSQEKLSHECKESVIIPKKFLLIYTLLRDIKKILFYSNTMHCNNGIIKTQDFPGLIWFSAEQMQLVLLSWV